MLCFSFNTIWQSAKHKQKLYLNEIFALFTQPVQGGKCAVIPPRLVYKHMGTEYGRIVVWPLSWQ